jgi:hypothetical protein
MESLGGTRVSIYRTGRASAHSILVECMIRYDWLGRRARPTRPQLSDGLTGPPPSTLKRMPRNDSAFRDSLALALQHALSHLRSWPHLGRMSGARKVHIEYFAGAEEGIASTDRQGTEG